MTRPNWATMTPDEAVAYVRSQSAKPHRRKRYYGEEAEQLTPAECAAADALMARMSEPDFDLSSIVEAPPKRVRAIVRD